jgi:peroxiredoxin
VPVLEDGGAARHLVSGLALPDIDLPSTQGGSISLARAVGRNVFYVYPWTGRPGLPDPPNWDDIPGAHGSTPEAQGFRDLHEAFRAAGVGVFGISGQDTAYQQEFSERCALPFALLSDAGGLLRSALSLPTFETGGILFLKRLTLIVRDGKIASLVYPVNDPAGHAADLIALLADAK